ncbi:hypothetical protein Glove_18g123 [Diversispora epigaea]|uniref:Uncharacterized protein n=1 Tax=Diversispora epigaea TaxID=1348612 RepID=A0A397JLC7_9GLOM|nr:hypothetical protein Glove_18g123 [Diversispora epigaea]
MEISLIIKLRILNGAHKKKICLGLWNSYKRAVKQIFDNRITQEFFSLKEAEHATGIKSQNIGAVCQSIISQAGRFRMVLLDQEVDPWHDS